jgi:hypothetical protein
MRFRSGLVVVLLLLLLAAPQVAAAVGPSLTVKAQRLTGGKVAYATTPWRVRITMRPFVAGQVVGLGFFRNGKGFRLASVQLTPTAGGTAGVAVLPFVTGKVGRIGVKAVSAPTASVPAIRARTLHVRVVALKAAPGARGFAVRLLQRELRAAGYVVGHRGSYDDRTGRAVLAFRKVTGMARTTIASPTVFRRLAHGAGRFHVRHPNHGKHVEADLSLQVLALIRGRHVERIYPLSSGKPSTPTVLGSFRVYSKTPGFNSEGMYYSNYFIRGYAIHGYASVPVFAASHGCLRVPIPDAASIQRWLHLGDVVWVYA